MNRIDWIDGSRGLALLLMLLAHFSPLLSSVPPILSVIFRLAPFLFFFLVGVGLDLSLDRRNRPSMFYFLRGGLLIVGGLSYNLLENNLMAAGFFQLIGAAIIVAFLLRRLSGRSLLVEFSIVSLIITISFPIQGILTLWQPQNQLTNLLVRFFFFDYFAFFPWVSVVLLGLIFSSWEKERRLKAVNLPMLVAAIICLIAGVIARWTGVVLEFDPVSLSMFFAGLFSLALLVVVVRIGISETPAFVKRVLSVIGNYTIELLVVQWFFFRTLPYYFLPGWRIEGMLTEIGFVLFGVLALICLAFILKKIANRLFEKFLAPLYAATIILAILEVSYAILIGFSFEIYLLAFVSSMMMAFAMRGLRKLKTS